LTIITLFFLVSLLYLALPDFTRRADQAINNIFHFLNTSEGAGSVGHRAVMFILGLQIALDNWLLGVGLGDFTIKFTEYLNQRKFISIGTNQPHNQYLFSWATSGILALISIGGIFYTLIKINKKVNDSYTYLRTGLITLFLIILFFENHLLRSNSSLLFVYFLALFFGRKPQNP
jgi:O-antigen ligase